MDVGPLINRAVITVGPRHSVAEAARRMREGNVGSAVVETEEGHPGIITERDLLRAIADGVDAAAARVEDYMTATAITASPNWSAVDAATRMLDGGFRHLVVLADDGRVAGILSIRDLVAALIDELPRKESSIGGD
jgi:CBS domain-containing protein